PQPRNHTAPSRPPRKALRNHRPGCILTYLITSLIALGPASGMVYALVEFRKLEVGHDNDVDPEELAARFKEAVGAFGSTPFADDESQRSLSLEHGIW
ncbi:hypothetical protein ACIRPC_19210, partial [Streptomyces globisporus]